MTRVSPVREAARKLLADGEWRSIREVVRTVARQIPPGVAHREYQRVRANPSVSQAVKIHEGQRYMATEAIRDMVINRTLDFDGDSERMFEVGNRVRLNAAYALERRQNAETLAVGAVARQWRIAQSLIRLRLRDEWVIVTARLHNTRLKPEALPHLARELALVTRRKVNRPVLFWAPYDMQQWGLFNKVTGDWERADGSLILRKSEPEYGRGEADLREADGAFPDDEGGMVGDLV